MIQYFLNFDLENHLINVQIEYNGLNSDEIILNLPLWRPGRYQAQNFPKNILNFSAHYKNNALDWVKTTTHTWVIASRGISELTINYSYYANEINAGSSFISQDLIYINPVNLCMFRKEDFNNPFRINILDVFDKSLVSCGLKFTQNDNTIIFESKTYYHFFDSPLIISPNLDHYQFTADNIPFNLWIYGHQNLNIDQLLNDLKKTASLQIRIFGSFPEEEYHFQLIIPPFSYYHGVEHRNSTLMVLSDNGLLTQESYNELLGLASHELFHAWNIAKIRPKELLPYDYTSECYFDTCFVAEGFTTYFGDKVLYDAGVFTKEQYRHELETLFRRHFEKNDAASQSLLESSFDLWVDGYEAGVPNKKVSVYHKGAIVTLILDSMIKSKWNNERSMENVMQKLNDEFGNLSKGYDYQDIIRICESVYGGDLKEYFSQYISGNGSVFEATCDAVKSLGITLSKSDGVIQLSC